MSERFRFIDLFAGIGGFHHALGEGGLGGECVLAVESDELCRLVYHHAFPGTPVHGDIRTITRDEVGADRSRSEINALVPDHDVLCAGFPCQPFSKSGSQQGIRDKTRGTLFFDIMEIIRAKSPRYVVLENVPNVAGPRHRSTWSLIIASLRDAGYRVSSTPVILSPHRLSPPVGAPQARARVFVLAVFDPARAHLDEPPLLGKAPDPTWHPSKWSLVGYLHESHPGHAYDIRPVELMWLTAWDEFVKGLDDKSLPGFPLWVDSWRARPHPDPSIPTWKWEIIDKNIDFYRRHASFLDSWMERAWDDVGTTVLDFPASRRKFEWQARHVHPTGHNRTLWDLLIHLRPSGIRVKPATYFPALVAMTQTSIVASLLRRITPKEAALLQGIPFEPFEAAGISDSEIYRQLGNAVNVGVVRLAASSLFEHGESSSGSYDHADFDRLTA